MGDCARLYRELFENCEICGRPAWFAGKLADHEGIMQCEACAIGVELEYLEQTPDGTLFLTTPQSRTIERCT